MQRIACLLVVPRPSTLNMEHVVVVAFVCSDQPLKRRRVNEEVVAQPPMRPFAIDADPRVHVVRVAKMPIDLGVGAGRKRVATNKDTIARYFSALDEKSQPKWWVLGSPEWFGLYANDEKSLGTLMDLYGDGASIKVLHLLDLRHEVK